MFMQDCTRNNTSLSTVQTLKEKQELMPIGENSCKLS